MNTSNTPNTPSSSNKKIDERLLAILVCPITKAPLIYDRENNELISEQAQLAYPVREGIPILLVEEARKLESLPAPA